MSNTIKLNIIAPGKPTISEEIISLSTENSDGRVEFMANHAPIISSTIPTISIIRKVSGEVVNMFTSTGIIYIKDNVINFTCDAYDYAEDIDIARAENAKNRAEQRLKSKENVDIERAGKALQRAIVRIKLKNNK